MFFNLSLQAALAAFHPSQPNAGVNVPRSHVSTMTTLLLRSPHWNQNMPDHIRYARPTYLGTTGEPLKDKAWLPVSHVLRQLNTLWSLGVLRGAIL